MKNTSKPSSFEGKKIRRQNFGFPPWREFTSHPIEQFENAVTLAKYYQNLYTQIIYLELEFLFNLFNGGIDLPPFPRLVRYVVSEYGTGD